ncbi:MAG: hypothetical protein WAK48_21175 [Candidatus Acidiferrum sp.]
MKLTPDSKTFQRQWFINGYAVRYVPPEWLVKFHTGYKLDRNDFRDVRALCERFGIALPDEYLKEPENG